MNDNRGLQEAVLTRGNGEAAIRRRDGLSGFTNQSAATPKVSVAEVSADIAQALHRSWFFDANPVCVSLEDGTVWLTGTVETPQAREIASSSALAAIGVTHVENHLNVTGGHR